MIRTGLTTDERRWTQMRKANISRRGVLVGAAASLALPGEVSASRPSGRRVPATRVRCAAITTEFRVNSHADVIISKFATGCDYPGAEFRPAVDLVSLYLDQTPANDTGHAFAREHNIPIYP